MRRRTGVGLLCLLIVAALCYGWWLGRRPPRSVVLITLDTTRADRLGCYGYAEAATPNLDRLAEGGWQFDRAYTAVPITLPSHATMLTGQLPPEHGLRINGVSRLPDDATTLAELLQANGYRTGAFVSSLVLDERFGLGQGFDTYDDDTDDENRIERSADGTVSAAIAWLTGAADQPVFCWVHLYDPHEPYDPHLDEFGDRFAQAPYDGEIAWIDRHIGRLLATLTELGLDDRAIVIVAGDHGEGLGQHAESTHGYLAYESTMHVPLLIRRPGETPSGARVAEPVSLVDLFPTILSELKIPVATLGTGRNLFGPATSGERTVYGETLAPWLEGGWSPLRTWTTGQWKYIESTRPELYDLSSDPLEVQNLLDQQPDQAALLQQALLDFEATLAQREGAAAATTAQDVKALRTLGYAGGQPPAGGSDHPLRDIKDMLPYAEQVHQCMHLIDLQQPQDAQRILEQVVAAVPDYPKAWGTLGVCLAVQGDFGAAEPHYRRALELDANQNFARIGLGRALFSLDRLEECVAQLQQAVELEPSALDAHFYLGEACRRLQRWDESRRALAAAADIDPTFADARLALADLALDQGNLEAAAEDYGRALQLNPQLLSAAVGRSRVLSQLDRPGEAIELLEAVVARSPQHVEALTQLAQLLATARNTALRNPPRGVTLAETACRLTNRTAALPLRALAAAQAAAGKKDSAVKSAEESLAVARANNDSSLAAEIERELVGYRTSSESINHQP